VLEITPSKDEKEITDKLKVNIYVPLVVCACQWERFMNSVFTAMQPYVKKIKFQTKNLDSEEARKLNLRGNSVVVEEKEIFTSPFLFKQKLPELLKEKGII